MKIQNILINHMQTPLGFDLADLRISFELVDTQKTVIEKQLSLIVDNQAVYTTGWTPFPVNWFDVDLGLEPRTRYQVVVSVRTPDDDTQVDAISWFETGKMTESFAGEWITSAAAHQNTIFTKTFTIAQADPQARLYLTGLGVYEAYLDDRKIGSEFLAPGITAYDQLVQVQTYDVGSMLTPGRHTLSVSVGDGWYMGNYGFDGGKDCIYGTQQMIIGELHSNGTVIKTDATWETAAGKITKSAIYYGEDLDDTRQLIDWAPAITVAADKKRLQDRLSLPLVAHGQLAVQKIIHTPAGETVLDFGQNQAGWMTFYNREAAGTKLTFEAGEILQHGNFYRGNLREARAAFTYVSNGQEKWVRPHFTYFGYRYIRVTGNTQALRPDDFKAVVLYSDMRPTGSITTSNKKANRLFENIQWGQKSNFFDVPTDCPQRDERLGWTGDANIFSNTAAFNMDVYAFFKKYARDMAIEQRTHQGMVTMYAPAMGNHDGGAAVWGDAATIIPWNMYQAYGDPAILKQNYGSMKAWVDWITQHTTTANLWTGGFQFGDWIALDGENPALPTGKTDEDFIASVYYHYSAQLVGRTARLLGHQADAEKYLALADTIKRAIQAEYVTITGRLALDTQTAYALALYFDLVPQAQRKRVTHDLVARLHKDDDHLKNGFVGTPFICQVLSANGEHKLAMKLFMNQDFPSWLYAVNMGATTVWERWNSVLADGTMNPDGMNSLNHYSIGAIMEWAYHNLLGIAAHDPGYQQVTLAPQFDYRLNQISGHFDSPYGRLAVQYQIETDRKHTIRLAITVPVGMTVNVKLPRSAGQAIFINETPITGKIMLTTGIYQLSYVPTKDYIERYSLTTPVAAIMANAELVSAIDAISSALNFFKDPNNVQNLGKMDLPTLDNLLPFINIPQNEMQSIAQVLKTTPMPMTR